MKKILSLLLTLLLALGLFGCTGQQPEADTQPSVPVTEPAVPDATEPEITEPEVTEPPLDETKLSAKLPEGATVFGLDLGGKNIEQATEEINKLISGYRLKLTVNNKTFTFSSDDLSMDLSNERFAYWFSGTVEGRSADNSRLILCNINKMLATVKSMFGETAKDASITYRSDLYRFVVEPHRDGMVVDTQQVEKEALAAIRSLSPAASATAELTDSLAAVKEDDPRVQAAMNEANSYLNLSLSYTFYAEGITPAREDLDIPTLASFLTLERDFSVSIDETAVQKYVKQMASRHGGSRTSPFVTTYGTTVGYNVEYYRAVLDQAAMCQDLVNCLKNKTSGTRSTSYYAASNADKPYGGDYVEVNLTDQCLWVYLDGEMKITTPLVSGNVSTRKWTDPGVFTLYEKERNATLVGTGYVSYVDYWMAFNGPIGLHDANWRSQFGGEIYKYNGSHGCVNLPVNAAKQIYDYVYVGMKVIVYGGAKSVTVKTQEITGTDAYTVTTDTAPFNLDVSFKYGDTEITYTSSDTHIVTVNHLGIVTVVSPGTATITVDSKSDGAITAASFTVTVTVQSEEPPEPTDPEPTDPSEPTAPTEPTDPEPTDPGESTAPTEPTDPSEPPEPTDPEPESTDPTDPA